jgi:GDP-L-fucose synthase
MDPASRIYVAGHRGLAGGAILRALENAGFRVLITRTHAELDLCSQAAVEAFFAAERPEFVFLAAARVGGIRANSTYPADFIRDNLQIQTNVIHAAWRAGVKKLCFLGSSCIYPRLAPQPMREEHLLTGALEPTNEWYAIAKIAGIKMCQAYRRQHGFNAISLMPTNLYGPGDNFDVENAHVLPALLRRFHEAREQGVGELVVWGTGTPRREFLHADDLASAAIFMMQHYESGEIVNIGTGTDVSIAELASLIKAVTGFTGVLRFDPSRPDGTPRKLLDVSRARALGWQASIRLEDGLRRTYDWFRQSAATARR